MKRFSTLALTAVLALPALALSGSAFAGDVQGDAYDCQELWVMRNQVYKDNGYCFTSARATTYFGEGACDYHSEADLPLSKPERRLIKDVRASERRQGC